MTPLDKPLRRELQIGEQAYTLIIDPQGLKLVEKGRRKGVALRWDELVSGDAALARALQASLGESCSARGNCLSAQETSVPARGPLLRTRRDPAWHRGC